MTIEQERMTVVLEARLDKLEKGFQKARQAANTNFNAISTDAAKMEAALARVSAPSLDRIARSASAFKVQTGNLAAQFNDIGVQLAGGQSPLLIALQQGTQITQALGPMGAGAAVKALGAGFASMLNPLSLLTVAVIGLGGTAVQKLSEWLSAGELTEQQLREQENLIRAVAERWGDALPAIRAYVEELDKIKDAADRNATVEIVIGKAFDKASESLNNFLSLMDGAGFNAFNASANEATDNVARLEQSAGELEKKLKNNQDATQEFARVQELLTELLRNSAIQANEDLSASVAQVAAAYRLAAQDAGKLAAANAAIDGTGKTSRLEPGLRLPEKVDVVPSSGGGQSPYFEGGRGSRGRAKQDSYAREANQIKERTELLKAEAAAQAELNPLIDDFGFVVEKARAEQELLNAAKQHGKEITPELREEIEKIATAYASAKAAVEGLKQAQQDSAKAIEEQERAYAELGDIGVDAAQGLANALADGKLEARELLPIIMQIIQQLLAMKALGALFGNMFSGMTGGSINFFKPGLYASGGRISGPGGPRGDRIPIMASDGEYMVNARAAEQHLPLLEAINSGRMPHMAEGGAVNRRAQSVLSSGMINVSRDGQQGATFNFSPTIQASGNAATDDRLLQEMLKQYDRDFVPKVVLALRKARLRGLLR